MRTPIAGIDIVTGPATVGLADVGVRLGEAVADGGVELDGAGLDGAAVDGEAALVDGSAVVGGSAAVGGAELVDGRGDSPDGATSLHPASASTTTRAPSSLTPRQ
ncbi:hypothetical protein [Kribbella sp. NPDC003557]|uniref:hypothetical protein n=1 Tax=Kribbella sp. NPDC003557 TaxID=3154449 RepID=UPI0033B6EDB3